jgi:DnaJ-class molecular chaperone
MMMTLSADGWLKVRYPDPTCGGDGQVSVNLVTQQCPDCKGKGLDERRIAEDTGKGLIPKWVLEQRTV